MNKHQTSTSTENFDPSLIPASVVTECEHMAHEEERLQRAYEAGRASAFDQVNSATHTRRFANHREYEGRVLADMRRFP